jgi:hypothetical protein
MDDVILPGFRYGKLGQLGADPLVQILRHDGQGPDFGQILPAELQGAASDNLIPLIDKHLEIPYMIVKLAEGASEQLSPSPVKNKKLVNRFDIFYGCFTYHGPWNYRKKKEKSRFSVTLRHSRVHE